MNRKKIRSTNERNETERNKRREEQQKMKREKKTKMLVNGRQKEVHVHKVNGLELRKRIARASENIHWSIVYNTTEHIYIHISSIHIQAPFYLWPFILRCTLIVCLSLVM